MRALKVAAALVGAALAASACAPANNPPNFPVAAGGRLISHVVDQANDAGRGASVAIAPNGDLAVSYILATAVLKPGALPVGIVAGQPQPPGVVLATFSGGVWNRVAVTEQPALGPAKGTATEVVDAMGHALPGVTTALAIDASGKHHVIWSTPTGLFYADDATGTAFGSPEKVVDGPVSGGSIAVAPDGSSWVSFYAGEALTAAHRVGGKWALETVAAKAGPAAPSQVTAIQVGGDGNPVIAYGDHAATAVTRMSADGWSTPAIHAGGLGVSLALDKDGNPVVGYYDTTGEVHLATASGVADVAGTSPNPSGDPAWSTGVGVDESGKVYLTWADTAAHSVMLATGQPSSLSSEPVLDSADGINPSLAVSKDGNLAIAWFDSDNANLNVATSPVGGTALAFPTPQLSQPSIQPPTTTCSPTGSTVMVVAPVGAAASGFDQKCFAAPAGSAFTIDFNNMDAGVMHNVEIYTKAPLDGGTHLGGANGGTDVITGPATTMYNVTPLKAGMYYFQCDVHPTQMFGTFVVARA
jgi:plastocyanin